MLRYIARAILENSLVTKILGYNPVELEIHCFLLSCYVISLIVGLNYYTVLNGEMACYHCLLLQQIAVKLVEVTCNVYCLLLYTLNRS